MKRNLITLLTVAIMLVLALPVAAAPSETTGICGEPQVFALTAGQTIPVGSVTVSNDEDNLYVTYETTGGWLLKEAQLYVLDYEPMVRLSPGQAPYKNEFVAPYPTSHTFTVPLGEVVCGTTLWLQAHATVVKLNEFGNEVENETAYGGNITPSDGGSWYGNIMYVVQCCEEEPCYEFVDETAWAFGPNYIGAKQWAMYVEYYGEAKMVDLIAGQTMDVGDVAFSAPVDGMVTITITLTGDWVLNPYADGEAVKIQGYDAAPSGNPSPGLFTTYKGNDLTVTVPAFAFYSVHVDVGYWMEVECPVE